jgi:hypothetical protein
MFFVQLLALLINPAPGGAASDKDLSNLATAIIITQKIHLISLISKFIKTTFVFVLNL